MLYSFETYTFDCSRRELRRAAGLVRVEAQVFDLLEYLIRNRHRVVSRDDLIGSIWAGRTVSESALNTRINGARTAIGDCGADQRLIKTFPRKGIRFVAEVREEMPTDRSATGLPPRERSPANADVRHSVETIPAGQAHLPLPDKPSIAVLPFTSLSPDHEQEYFADGIANDLIAALSRYPSLLVIARNSSFGYKGVGVNVQRVGRELGVPYSGGRRYRVKSPPIVSAKREYSRTWPETFCIRRPEIVELGAWRRERMRKKPGFPAHSRVLSEA